MPTVLESEGLRFFFYLADRNEPPHIHVRKAGQEAKFALILSDQPFQAGDLRQMTAILEEKEGYFMERWNEQFNR